MRILIVKHGALGDVVRTTAILPALKAKFTHGSIHWVTSPAALALVNGLPHLDSAGIPKDFAPGRFHWDWVLSLDDEKEICQWVSEQSYEKLSGAFLNTDSHQIEYSPDVEPWFGMGILRPEPLGGIDRANELKQANSQSHPEIFYKMLDLPAPLARPLLPLTEEHKAKAEQWLARQSASATTWIGLNTGAAPRWKYKSWGLSQTAELAHCIAEHDPHIAIVLLGGSGEKERNLEIHQQAGSDRVFMGPNDWSLLEFAGLIDRCQTLVSSDSLALHLGLATHTPVVAFFGPTSSAEITLYDQGEKIVTPLSCRCCYLKDCNVRPHCMESIKVEEIFQATVRALS